MAVTKISSEAEYDAVLRNNRGVFVDFYADWCGPCRMVSPLVDKISDEYSSVKFVKVNTDEFPDIAQRYGIMSIPTLIAFRDGAVVSQSVGFKPEAELRTVVDQIR